MMTRKKNNVGNRLLMLLVGLFLYAPIFILIIFLVLLSFLQMFLYFLFYFLFFFCNDFIRSHEFFL